MFALRDRRHDRLHWLHGITTLIVVAANLTTCKCRVVAGNLEDNPDRPNIVLMLVDDMGWMDSGAYGSEYYKTPNIDAFARRALRFTNAYSQPLCSPTR